MEPGRLAIAVGIHWRTSGSEDTHSSLYRVIPLPSLEAGGLLVIGGPAIQAPRMS